MGRKSMYTHLLCCYRLILQNMNKYVTFKMGINRNQGNSSIDRSINQQIDQGICQRKTNFQQHVAKQFPGQSNHSTSAPSALPPTQFIAFPLGSRWPLPLLYHAGYIHFSSLCGQTATKPTPKESLGTGSA